MKSKQQAQYRQQTKRGVWFLWLTKLCLLVIFSLSQGANLTAENLPTDENHRGLVEIGDYTIFPENRKGNALYQQELFLTSQEDRTIQAAIKVGNGTLYGGRTGEGLSFIGYYSAKEYELEELFTGYAWLNADNRRLLFWFSNQTQNIKSILPQLKSLGGLTHNNVDKLAMYHISVNNANTSPTTYFFNIHVFKENNLSVQTVGRNIADTRSFLVLNWISPNQLEYELKNGKKIRIAVN